VIFYNCHIARPRFAAHGFTLVEAVCAIALIGVGVASTLGALTKFNSIAATSRNATGAAAVVMNQIDLFQSMSPFNPQKNQIPIDTDNTPPTYDMTAGTGTHTVPYKDPSTGVVSNALDPWPIYREPARWTYADAATRTGATGFLATDIGQLAYESATLTYWRLQTTAPAWAQDLTGGMIVRGTMTCTVTDISTIGMPNTYNAVFTIGYQYRGRGPIWNATSNRWEYQLSMNVIRTSDI
jgi:prepilin-type N-terminal cleavage/methylation domain-containing protein